MVMDGQHGGVPVAWYITSRSCTTSVESFLEASLHAARKIRTDFEFGSVGCDDANEEINAIRWHLAIKALPAYVEGGCFSNSPQKLLPK